MMEITTATKMSFEIERDSRSSDDFDVAQLLGQTIRSITPISIHEEMQELHIVTDQGVYVMFHRPDCCEHVWLEDIAGDLEDLIGSPLLQSEVVTNRKEDGAEPLNEDEESFTWTFYKFATIKGSVTLRWYGRSNGYYSERVTVVDLFEKEDVGEWLDTQCKGFTVASRSDWTKFTLRFTAPEDAFHFKMKWV